MGKTKEIEEVASNLTKVKLKRKDFLKLTAAASAVLAISTIPKTAIAKPAETKPKHRYTMVIDLARCIGCEACTVACKVEHNVPVVPPKEFANRIQWTEVFFKEKGKYPNVKIDLNPRPCMHCENPPCVPVCPVKGTYIDKDRGLVLQDYDRCKGLGYCIANCPYDARYFNYTKPDYGGKLREAALNPDPNPQVRKRRKGVAEKCTFCVERLERLEAKAEKEGRPIRDEELHLICACVRTCMGRARLMGDLNDPNSMVSKLARSKRAFHMSEELGTKPKVVYLREV